jgi:DNA-binding transcriptional ArsR family regulator
MIHFVDTASVPIFRNDAQFRLLGELFTNPSLEVTVGELQRRLRLPQATVSREVASLRKAGLVRVRREGNRTLVTANTDTSIAPELRSILSKLYGPTSRIRAALADARGLTRAAIFGSWAARWAGEAGPPPRDIDLLVIGDVNYGEIWSLAADLSREFGIDVNPTIRTAEEWDRDRSGFAQQVKNGPLVDVTPDTNKHA